MRPVKKKKVKGEKSKTRFGIGFKVTKGVTEDGVKTKVVTDRKGRVRKVKTKKDGEKTVVKNLRSGRTDKQKNKSKDGVKTRYKMVGRGDGRKLMSKEKQSTNRKGRKAGVISFKEKIVDRPDFSVRHKTRGITPNAGS